MRTPRLAVVPLLALLAPGVAGATNVSINGVPVDGLANQKFEKVTVTFDEKGNVNIVAPGVQVSVSDPNARPPAQPTTGGAKLGDAPSVAPSAVMTKHYFLVTEQAKPGATGYDVDIFINSKWIRKLKGNEDQIVLEITKYLTPGANKILFSAKKSTGERKSFSPSDTFNVIIGEGAAGGDQVMIDNPIITFKRTAADTDDVSEEYPLNTR